MSGLHASINTHISDGFEDPQGNQVHNLTYFRERVGAFEDRIKNLHLIYAVVVKAVATVEPTLLKQTYSANMLEEVTTKDLERQLLRKITGECDEPFKERLLFSDKTPDSEQMSMLSSLQHRFYNISRIMDCVSCDKCRLNGKLQVRGLATALKVLFLPDTFKQKVM